MRRDDACHRHRPTRLRARVRRALLRLPRTPPGIGRGLRHWHGDVLGNGERTDRRGLRLLRLRPGDRRRWGTRRVSGGDPPRAPRRTRRAVRPAARRQGGDPPRRPGPAGADQPPRRRFPPVRARALRRVRPEAGSARLGRRHLHRDPAPLPGRAPGVGPRRRDRRGFAARQRAGPEQGVRPPDDDPVSGARADRGRVLRDLLRGGAAAHAGDPDADAALDRRRGAGGGVEFRGTVWRAAGPWSKPSIPPSAIVATGQSIARRSRTCRSREEVARKDRAVRDRSRDGRPYPCRRWTTPPRCGATDAVAKVPKTVIGTLVEWSSRRWRSTRASSSSSRRGWRGWRKRFQALDFKLAI